MYLCTKWLESGFLAMVDSVFRLWSSTYFFPLCRRLYQRDYTYSADIDHQEVQDEHQPHRHYWWRPSRHCRREVCLEPFCRSLIYSIYFLDTKPEFRYLQAEDHFKVIDIFEQRPSFGGLWNYTPESATGKTNVPQTTPSQSFEEPIWTGNEPRDPAATEAGDSLEFSTPMYEGLETNIPHFLMEFSDDPSFRNNQLFPSRESTLQYLETYADDVRQFVKFQTQVIDIRLQNDNDRDFWQVTHRSISSGKAVEAIYDAVVIASGHYSAPYLPNIPGISHWNTAYPQAISHSKFYQRPEDFSNKKVLIVGNSASGHDISTHISSTCKLPIMISVRSEPPVQSTSSKTFRPEIAEFLSPSFHHRAIRFLDGRIEKDIEAIVFCTGYLYSYPFLSSIMPKFIGAGDRVRHLYQHIFSIDHPSLVFMGLPKPIIPFRTMEGQAALFARIWSDRLELPSKLEMQGWETAVLAEQGSGKKFHDSSYPRDFNYFDGLIEWALQAQRSKQGKIPPKWSEQERRVRANGAKIREMFTLMGEARHEIRTLEELTAFSESDVEGGIALNTMPV